METEIHQAEIQKKRLTCSHAGVSDMPRCRPSGNFNLSLIRDIQECLGRGLLGDSCPNTKQSRRLEGNGEIVVLLEGFDEISDEHQEDS